MGAISGMVQVRDATTDDLPQVQAIYAHHVQHGLGSFEEQAPGLDEMRRRFAEVTEQGYPYLVADLGGRVAGYGYCAPYRTRSAYRHTVEDSVYVRPDALGRGVGTALLAALIGRCEALGFRQMVAVVGDSGHKSSIALHEAHGFLRVGTLRSVGHKRGRWVDSVLLQRALGPGDGSPPQRP